MVWTLWQFGRIVADFAEAADEDMWTEMEARLFSLIEHGNALGWPASEPVGNNTGLFALRAKSGRAQGRLFYFFMVSRRIVFVHSVEAKKTRRFKKHDIDIALRRKREVEEADDITRIATTFTVQPHGTQAH
jgi:phage-related protein